MFDRFYNAELDGREDIKRDIALLRPELDRLKAEANAKRVEKQKELLPQRDALIQQRQAEIPSRRTEVQKLSEIKEKALAVAKADTEAYQRAATELAQRDWWFDHQLQKLQAQISELAPACIAERQRRWRDWIDESRLTVNTEVRTTAPDVWGQSHEIMISNISAINHRVNVINEAIKSAEKMKSHPMLEADAIERLDALEEKFPPLTTERETVRVPAPDVSELRRTSL